MNVTPVSAPATLDEFVALRRSLHAAPELGYEETGTSALVARLLTGWGYEVATGLGGTGVVATLRHGAGERRIGLRADMDALPIAEATGLPYASATPGVMHACGHDGRPTILLAAAKDLAERRYFSGTVGHGAMPHEAVDPIVAASSLVMALQSIVSRNVDPRETAVITVGMIHGGTMPTTIPDSVALQISVRSYTAAVRDRIRERIKVLAAAQAASYGAVAT